MRFLHLADLHLGRKMNEYDLLEDQRHVLEQALELVKKEHLDAVVLAGDIYDNGSPSGDTMRLLDWFLTSLSGCGVETIAIPGNHDNSARLEYGSTLFLKNHIHINTTYDEALKPITVKGVNFYALPYVVYQTVARQYGVECHNTEDAVSYLLSKIALNTRETNVLVIHQTVLPEDGTLEASGSETQLDVKDGRVIGGSDAIQIDRFKDFDYVALGHIHKPLPFANACYPGSLLKYDKDEANQKRAFNVVEIENKKFTLKQYPYTFLHDVAVIKDSFSNVMQMEDHQNDYVFFELSDPQTISEGMSKLKTHFKWACGLSYPNLTRAKSAKEIQSLEKVKNRDVMSVFAQFYQEITGQEIPQETMSLAKAQWDEVKSKEEQR